MGRNTAHGRSTGLWRLLCIAGLLAFVLGAWTGTALAAPEINIHINGEIPISGTSTVDLSGAITDWGGNLSDIDSLEIAGANGYEFSNNDWDYLTTSRALFTKLETLDLRRVTLTTGAEGVPVNFLKDNTAINIVKLPSGINAIGADAFVGCTNLLAIIMTESTPPSSTPTPFPAPINGTTSKTKATILVDPAGIANYTTWATSVSATLTTLPDESALNMTGNPTTPIQLTVNGTQPLTLTVNALNAALTTGQLFYTIPQQYGKIDGITAVGSGIGDNGFTATLTGLQSTGGIAQTVRFFTFDMMGKMISCTFAFTVTGGGGTPDPGPGPTPVVTTTVSFRTTDGTLLPAKQSGGTWWADVLSGTDISSLVAVMNKGGRQYESASVAFLSGIAQQLELKTDDGKTTEKVWVGVRLPNGLTRIPATQQTVNIVWETFGKGDVPILLVKPVLIDTGNVYINDFPGNPVIPADLLRKWRIDSAPWILDFLLIHQDEKKIPADPLVVAAGLMFKIQGTQDGMIVEKPKDLPDALNKLSLNKIFDVDANGTPTMMDLFNLLKPHIESGTITYNFMTGELKINVPITIVDGPVPDGVTGAARPSPGSKYGVVFDPVGGLLIYDGEADGIIFDPIALMLKEQAPATISLSPTAVSMDVGGTRDVTVTGGSVTWTTADGKIAKIEPANTPGLYKVTGLAAGTTTMTARLEGDPTVTATLSVTVNAVRTSGGSSGCNAGAAGLLALMMAAAYLRRKHS